jgi:hypothetical protein
MKAFFCDCGQRLFFENRSCTVCGRILGFDPERLELRPIEQGDDGGYRTAEHSYRRCANDLEHGACNWLIPAEEAHDYCRACRLNQLIPAIGDVHRKELWVDLEGAKRRLLYTLLQLGLPIVNKSDDPQFGLAFEFVEDQRSNPQADREFVLTGHKDGLITINLYEADPAAREAARTQLGERYRTPLGHLRHESGHYYWQALVGSNESLSEFRDLFGDERLDYETALQEYYSSSRFEDWQTHEFISRYAQAHPLEDWAETWAHYLHMVDTLETARSLGITQNTGDWSNLDDWLSDWIDTTVVLNELNRSMGLSDGYPFVLHPTVITKLRFVHRIVDPTPMPTQ